jgi:hypothetical protein
LIKNIPAFNEEIEVGKTVRATNYDWESVNNSYSRDIIILSIDENRTSFTGVFYNPEVTDYQFNNHEYAKFLGKITIKSADVASGKIALRGLLTVDDFQLEPPVIEEDPLEPTTGEPEEEPLPEEPIL